MKRQEIDLDKFDPPLERVLASRARKRLSRQVHIQAILDTNVENCGASKPGSGPACLEERDLRGLAYADGNGPDRQTSVHDLLLARDGKKPDADEIRRAAQAVRESEERLRIAIEAGRMYAFEWDLATDAVLRSEQSKEILSPLHTPVGPTKQDLINRLLPEDRQEYLASIRSLTPQHQEYKAVFRLPLDNGRMRWLKESGRAIFGTNGELAKVIGITSDVTEVRESECALRNLSGRLISSQDEERRRIARELHDHIGQELALLCMQAQRLACRFADPGYTTHSDAHELYSRLKAVAEEVSKLSRRLHSSELSYLGLATATTRLCRDFEHRFNVPVACHVEQLPSHLDGAKSLCIYRVLEESLRNAMKHSHATQVMVHLRSLVNEVALSVDDDGKGFDVDKAGSGLGLLSMRERVHFVGGRFTITSTPGSGTKVTASVEV